MRLDLTQTHLQRLASRRHLGPDQREQPVGNGREYGIQATRRNDVVQEAKHVKHEARVIEIGLENVHDVVADLFQLADLAGRVQVTQMRQERSAGALNLQINKACI